jgi:hypothetical protein
VLLPPVSEEWAWGSLRVSGCALSAEWGKPANDWRFVWTIHNQLLWFGHIKTIKQELDFEKCLEKLRGSETSSPPALSMKAPWDISLRQAREICEALTRRGSSSSVMQCKDPFRTSFLSWVDQPMKLTHRQFQRLSVLWNCLSLTITSFLVPSGFCDIVSQPLNSRDSSIFFS